MSKAGAAATAPARPRVQAPNFAVYQSRRPRPSFWRRFKNTLLGTEPVLEDSL